MNFTAEIRTFHDHVRLYSGPGLIEHTRFLDASGDRVAVGDLPAVPYRTGLTPVWEVDFEALRQATLRPELARDCAAMIVLGATFWRSRFKYGQWSAPEVRRGLT